MLVFTFFTALLTKAETQQVLIAELSQKLAPWMKNPPEKIISLQYMFDLNGQKQKIEIVRNRKDDNRYYWQGITLTTGMDVLLESPLEFDLTLEEGEKDLVLRAKKKTGQYGVKCGNGLTGWYGYVTAFSDEMSLVFDKNTRLPVKETHKTTEILYKDWIEAGPGRWAPGSIDFVHRDLVFHLRFRLSENGLWILDYSDYEFKKEFKSKVSVSDIKINDQELIARANREFEEKQQMKAIIQDMLDHNRIWTKAGLAGMESLQYTHRIMNEDVEEECYIQKDGLAIMELVRDGQGKAKTILGRRKILLPNNDYYLSTRQQEFATLQPLARGSEQSAEVERLRGYASRGTALQLPIFDLPGNLDSIGLERQQEEKWQDRICDVIKVTNMQSSYLSAGTMLGFVSFSYMHHQKPQSETFYIDKERHIPLHETFVSEKNNTKFEIDFKEWKEIAAGEWAPLRIEISSPGFFTCHYIFHLVNGKHWMMKEMNSWFDDTQPAPGTIANLKMNESSALREKALSQVQSTEKLLFRESPQEDKIEAPVYPFHIGKRTSVEASAESPDTASLNREDKIQNYAAIREVLFTLDEKGDLKAQCKFISTDFEQYFPVTINMALFDEKGEIVANDSLTTEVAIKEYTLFITNYRLNLGKNRQLENVRHFSVKLIKGPLQTVHVLEDPSLKMEEEYPEDIRYKNARYMVWDIADGLVADDPSLHGPSLERLFYFSDVYQEQFMNKPDSWVEDILQKVKKTALADLFPSDPRKDLIEPLIELRKRSNGEYERALIALSLGSFKDEKAKPALLDSYENRTGAEQRAAAASLGILGDAQGRGEIIAALKDPNEYICLNAVWALATLGGPEDARALTDALFYEKPTEKSGESGKGVTISNPYFRTRWQILRALAALQNPSSLPAIKTLLDQSKEYFMENLDNVILILEQKD